MENKLFFSIILPTYNRAGLISKAINSVLNQEYQLFELIIVDDGSTDQTEEVVKSYSDTRIKYFKKVNEERNIARNFGIDQATGDYIGFLDSDDEYYSNHLKEAESLILSLGFPEIIHLNYEFKDAEDCDSYFTKHNVKNINEVIIKENVLNCNSILIRSNILRKFKFIESKNAIVGEDHNLWLKLSCRFPINTSLVITNAIFQHDLRSLNIIDVSKLELGLKEILEDLRGDEEFLHYYGYKANQFFAGQLVFLALHLIMSNKTKAGLVFLSKALWLFPPIVFTKKFLAVLKNIMVNKY